MRKIGYTLIILTFIPYFNSGCAKNEAPNGVTAALALSAISRAGNQPSTVASAQAAVSATSSAIANAAKTGAFNMRNSRPEQMLAMVRKKAISRILKSSLPGVIPTSISVSSGSCVIGSGSCVATISGTESCSQGGSVTFNNLSVNMTYSTTTTGQFSFSNSMSGPVSLSQCATQSWDFGNFPSMIVPVISGNMDYNGSLNMNILSSSSTTTSFSANFTYKESDTINSGGLTVNGGSPVSIQNMVSKVDLQVSEVETNPQSSNIGTIYTFAFDVSDTLTGTYTVTGTVGGESLNISKTYNNNVYKYHAVCTIDSTAHTGTCSIN